MQTFRIRYKVLTVIKFDSIQNADISKFYLHSVSGTYINFPPRRVIVIFDLLRQLVAKN